MSRAFDLGVSAATVRNTMSDLEDKGYLFHPHTSAGRVPTETGYRLYVDDLMGIPKLPRVNPGTIVHNARLQGLIPADQRATLLAMPAAELWHLEDKYDVHMDQVYGPGRVVSEAPLGGYLVLNWHRDSDAALRVEPVTLDNRRDLLAAIMKSPGPFYQYPDGSFHRDDAAFDERSYLDVLQGVAIYEVSGRVDFDLLASLCLDELLVTKQ